MRIPKSVVVGPYRFKVAVVHDLHDDGQAVWGVCRHSKQHILIDDGMSETRREITFIHESLHAIDALVDGGLTEQQVTRLAPALYDFLRRNRLLADA